VVVCKLWKIVVVTLLALAGLLLTIGFFYYHGFNVSKVDRSNALQVTLPVTPEPSVASGSTDFFTDYRLERDKLRSEQSDLLREAMRLAKSDEARQRAQQEMLRIIRDKQQETDMENLIRANGFADALVFVRDNSVSAVVRSTTLSRNEAMKVADVISRVCGVKAEDITISAKP
jgi:stage III sporulation protein AH